MNIHSRLKKLESKNLNADICVCAPGVWFERYYSGEQRKPAQTPGNCQRCGKPMNENAARIIVPAKLPPEQWTEQSKASSNK